MTQSNDLVIAVKEKHIDGVKHTQRVDTLRWINQETAAMRKLRRPEEANKARPDAVRYPDAISEPCATGAVCDL